MKNKKLLDYLFIDFYSFYILHNQICKGKQEIKAQINKKKIPLVKEMDLRLLFENLANQLYIVYNRMKQLRTHLIPLKIVSELYSKVTYQLLILFSNINFLEVI